MISGSPCPPEFCGSSSGGSQNYYIKQEICEAVGYKIRQYIPNYYYDQLQRQYLELECKLLSRWDRYPSDIGGDLSNLTPDRLSFDVVVLELSESTIGALIPLLEAGKQILVLSEGGYLPFESNSVYNRINLFDSPEYVRRYPVDCGNGNTKYIYSGKNIGGLSALDENDFFLPPQSVLDDWSPISNLWSADKLKNTYSQYEYEYEKTETTKTKKTTVQSTPFGTSICVEESETTECTQIKSAYTELGYQSGTYNPYTSGPGFYNIPSLRKNKKNVLLVEEYLSYINEKYSNFDLSLYTRIVRLVFENNRRVSKVIVETIGGQTIEIIVKDYVLFGSSPIETAQLLLNSGVGESSLLQRYGIDQVISAPYLGKRFSISPVYYGCSMKAPSGSLFTDNEDYDTTSLSYLLSGDSALNNVAALNYYKLLLQSSSSKYVNIKVNTYVFSRNTLRRLQHYLKHVFQFSEEVQQFYLNEVRQNDIIIFGIQSLNSQSSAYIDFQGDTVPTPYIKYNMYENQEDIEDILYATTELKRLLQTTGFGGFQPLQSPFSDSSDIFSPEYINSNIHKFTAPSLYYNGGTIMGNSIDDSLVDQYCRLHGIPNLVLLNSGVIPINYNFGSIGSSLILGNYITDLLLSNYEKSTYELYYPDISSANSLSLSDINGPILPGGGSGSLYESSSSSSSSTSEENSKSSQTLINNGGLGGSSYASSSSSNSEYEAQESESSSLQIINGGGGYGSGLTAISQNSESEYESSQSENSFNSVNIGSGSGSGCGCGSGLVGGSGFSSVSQNSESEYEKSKSSDSFNSVNSGPGGYSSVSQNSESEYENSESSDSYSSVNYGPGGFSSVTQESESEFESESNKSSSSSVCID